VYGNPPNLTDPSGHDPWWCESVSDPERCYSDWLKNHAQVVVVARVYYLNQIGLEQNGVILPDPDPRSQEAYFIYRLGLAAGAEHVKHIPIYETDVNTARCQMFDEMFERGIWSPKVADTIAKDLRVVRDFARKTRPLRGS
jgi:hypothetical protein